MAYNDARHGKPIDTTMPKGGRSHPTSSAQTSGRVIRQRDSGMNIAGNVESNLEGMPHVHTATNTGGKKVGKSVYTSKAKM